MAPRAQRPKPVKEQVSSVGELAATALERIDDKFIGNEKQTAWVFSLILHFLKKKPTFLFLYFTRLLHIDVC